MPFTDAFDTTTFTPSNRRPGNTLAALRQCVKQPQAAPTALWERGTLGAEVPSPAPSFQENSASRLE